MAKIGEFNVPVHSPLTYTGGELLYQSGSLKLDGRSIGTVGQTLKVEGAATTTITDSGATGHVCTLAGTAALSTTQKKLGNGGLYLDGNSDYLTIPDHADWNFADGDFTIECFVRFTSTAGAQAVFNHHTNADNYSRLRWNGSVWEWYFSVATTFTVDFDGIDSPSTDTWYHLALVRNGNVWTIYRDGVARGTQTSATTYPNYSQVVTIGRGYDGSSAVNYFNGYIDEFRISNVARYTADFTAPTTAFVSDANTKLLLHCDLIPKWSA